MKTFNKIFMTLGVAATALGTTSCVNDLDLSPINPSVTTDVSKNMDQVFADIYLQFATYGANGDSPVKDFDGGMAAFQRAIFTAEEMPTDEACWLWDPDNFGTLNYGSITPDLQASFGFYSRLVINISLCNQFIQAVQNGEFDDAGTDRAQDYVRQAHILRGICYFYMLSFYENPPYMAVDLPIGAEPTQPGRQAIYDEVTSNLESVVAYYKENNKTDVYYGFVGLDVAEAVLAKIYLNAEVFTGTPAYDACYSHCKSIIDRLGHSGYYGTGLARSYQALFGYNNDKYALGNAGSDVNEIIWTIPASRTDNTNDLTGYSGSTFLIAAWNGTNGVESTVPCPTMDAKYASVTDPNDLLYTAKDKDGNEYQGIYVYCATQESYDAAKATFDKEDVEVWQKTVSEVIANKAYSFDPAATGWVSGEWIHADEVWKCMVARKSFVRKFDWEDVEMTKSNDLRVAAWQTASHGFSVENPSLVGDDWGKNGYLAFKYTNWAYNDDGTIDYVTSASIPTGQPYGGDYAAIRLAEIYLTAAEAILQGGGGSQAEALQYVNNIRQRAYGANYTPWTSLSMSDLQNERCRELYQENCRRTDLIRWNLWCTGYTWEWKGGVKTGTNLPEYTKSYPIPTRIMTSSSLQQQTGY